MERKGHPAKTASKSPDGREIATDSKAKLHPVICCASVCVAPIQLAFSLELANGVVQRARSVGQILKVRIEENTKDAANPDSFDERYTRIIEYDADSVSGDSGVAM